MKKVEVKELQNQVLLKEREALLVENEGKLLGYYYPVNDQENLEKLWENLDEVLEKAEQESGMNRENLINILDPRKPFCLE
jgi:hypothetical protein